MADFYRVNGSVGAIGDGKGWISTAAGASFIGKQPVGLAIVVQDASLNKANLANELGVDRAVEAILKAISANTTVLGYQIEAGSSGNLSVILEGAAGLSSTDAGIATVVQNTIRTLTAAGNNSVDCSGTAVVNRGLKLSYV